MALQCLPCTRYHKVYSRERVRVGARRALEDARGAPREGLMEAWEIIVPYLRRAGALTCTVGQEYDWELHATTSDWTLLVEIGDYLYEGDTFHYLYVSYTDAADPRSEGLRQCIYRAHISELIQGVGERGTYFSVNEPTPEVLATVVGYLLRVPAV